MIHGYVGALPTRRRLAHSRSSSAESAFGISPQAIMTHAVYQSQPKGYGGLCRGRPSFERQLAGHRHWFRHLLAIDLFAADRLKNVSRRTHLDCEPRLRVEHGRRYPPE